MKNRSPESLRQRLVPAISRASLVSVAVAGLCQCASGPTPGQPADVVVSVKDQKLAVYSRGGSVSKQYPVSTSKFGLGDKPGTYGTPLGLHEVVAKIGHGAPSGAVFKSRHWTGEVLKPNAPGRDPIVSRIMWLRGIEKENKNAYARCIYIHGTAEERNVGKPVSYGCIRMKSRDVIDLFNRLPIGSRVLVTTDALPGKVPVLPEAVPVKTKPDSQPPIFLEPKQQPMPEPPPQTPVLAQNTATSRKHSTEVAVDADPAPSRSIQPQKLSGGGALLYSAPTGSSGPGVVIKSKRTATQGFQN